MKPSFRLLSMGVTLLIAGLLAPTPARASTTRVIGPSDSIQTAVDAAKPGGIVLLRPGIYRQTVRITRSDVTVRGSGAAAGGSLLVPPAAGKEGCGPEAEGVNGFCLLHAANIRISSLHISGFSGDGIIGFYTDRLVVDHVTADHNGDYGIARFNSTRSRIIANKASDDGTAGIYVGDSAHADTLVVGNEVWDNTLGLFLRHASHATAAYNDIHDNCVGIAILGEPSATDWTITHNTVTRNNRKSPMCDLSGVGIVAFHTTYSLIGQNTLLGNRGQQASGQPPPGGILLVGGSSGNRVVNNTAYRDSTDLIYDKTGTGNVFRGNHCGTSHPKGLCR
jgi:nitrous oxidase accessory protein NosD